MTIANKLKRTLIIEAIIDKLIAPFTNSAFMVEFIYFEERIVEYVNKFKSVIAIIPSIIV